jgi:steroid 5-alpha reductase family enzyme
MKQSLLNLLFSFLAFSIAYGIACLTGLELIQQAILIAFIIQWIAFVPAYIFQTEKFYDLTGSITYISVVSYVSFQSNSALDINIGGILLASFIMLWAIRLGSFLFLRIHKAGEDKRFKLIKPSPTRFFMTWTLQGMWVSLCSMCALTAIASKNGVGLNTLFFIGAFVFLSGLIIEIIADKQKSSFRANPENKEQFIRHGLWSYSRHPNYFGEITLWLGISIMSLSSLSGWQYVTLISPLFTYLLLVYVSGVRLLEISGMEKWGHLESYQTYLIDTPSLFPFKKLFMKKTFTLIVVFCLSSMYSFGQDEVSLPLSINATPKSIGIISTINIPNIEGNSKGQIGISTNQTKLYYKNTKNKIKVIFEVPNASEILSKGFGAKTVSKKAVAWTLDETKEQQQKLYITSASDSALNYIIYSGYVYFPNLNKWKLIASYKVNGYTEHIHAASIFKSTNIQQNIEELFTDTWTQGDNGAWINVQNKGIEKPILPPFSDLDSLYRVKQDSLIIRKAIQDKQTDAVTYKNGLYYHLMKSSENQSLVKMTDTVSIYYKGYIFGTDIVFDQTTNDTRTFPLGRLIKGWQVGLEGTRVGEKVKLLIPSGLAYSIRTRSPKIPPNSILVFEIETVNAKSQ